MSFNLMLENIKTNNTRLESEISDLESTLRGFVGHLKSDRPETKDLGPSAPVPVPNHFLEDLERETYRSDALITKLIGLHRHFRERIHGEQVAGATSGRLG